MEFCINFDFDFLIRKKERASVRSPSWNRILSHFFYSLSFSLSPSSSGGQWAVIDTNYPRFALTTSAAALPTSTVQHSSSLHHSHHHHHHHHQSGQQTDGQGGNDNLSLSSNHSSSHGSSSNSNSNNNTTIQSSTPVQLQYQTTYSPQIIAVNPNNIVNSYPPSISTPTSPIVQSVYSQQSTPIQSPVNIQNSNSDAGGSSANNVTNATANVTPAPPKRKRSVNPQGEENFLRALDAVRFGGIGFCKGILSDKNLKGNFSTTTNTWSGFIRESRWGRVSQPVGPRDIKWKSGGEGRKFFQSGSEIDALILNIFGQMSKVEKHWV